MLQLLIDLLDVISHFLRLLRPRQELGDIHRTLAGVCKVTNKLENFSGNHISRDIVTQIILSNVEDDNRRMASTHGWQMVSDTPAWYLSGPQSHATLADVRYPDVRHSQMGSGR